MANNSSETKLSDQEVRVIKNKIKVHTSRKATLFQRVQQAFDLIKKLDDPKVVNTFRVRCRDLEETRNDFFNIAETIHELQLSLTPDEEINQQALIAFDDVYYHCLAALTEINSTSTSIESTSNSTNPSNSTDTVRLPKIELKTFDGTLEKFIPWYNLFCSVINKSNIPSVQKLLYLQSCLVGEPLNLIKHLPATDVNYKVAIDILLDRYNSKRKLASNYVEKLFTIEPLKNESYSKLRSFYENLTEQYYALEALKLPDLSDFILFHITFRNLDPVTRKTFESRVKASVPSAHSESSDILPTFKQLLEFLGNQCKILESSNLPSGHNTNQRSLISSLRTPAETRPSWDRNGSRRGPSSSFNKGAYVAATSLKSSKNNNHQTCPVCNAGHSIYVCHTFRSLSVPDRKNKITSIGRCVRCLGNHLSSKCGSKSTCVYCSKPFHHSLLHLSESSTSEQPVAVTGTSNFSSSTANDTTVFSSVAQSPEPSTVLLGTALVHIQDVTGEFIDARVLIDSGSQCSFLSKKFFTNLKLPYTKTDITVTGLGQTNVTQRKAIASIVIKPRLSSSPILSTQVVVMDNLAGYLPSNSLPERIKDSFSHLPLADPHFYKSAPLDGIIGAELFPMICKGSPQPGGPGLPTALPSLFGWIIMGPITTPLHLSAFVAEVQLDEALKKFWEIEQPPSAKIVDPDAELCESIFNSHMRDTDGRYVVPLLLKTNHKELGGSFGYSMRCLLNTERRLEKHPTLKEAYHSFMRDYEDSGHMRKVNINLLSSSYFIPHHAVFNPSSPSTKIRIVFNGSALSTSGLSLNHILHSGPKLQQDITSIIFNFRFHTIAFTADICKMYRQIKVLSDQTKFQRILWRYSPTDPVSAYELLVVTWGLRSSSYLACRSLLQLADDEATHYPRVDQVIKDEMYVDDLVSGEQTISQALKLQADLITVFSKAGFELKKWSCNHPALISSLPSDSVQTPLLFDSLEDQCRIKVLGLQWNPTTDTFTYKITPLEPKFTKREILSDISKLYDPMGWLSPVVLLAKSFIQQLWLEGVGWDESIPIHLQELWISFVRHFQCLSDVQIPRLVFAGNDAEYYLLGFSDASEKGYAAVLYLHVKCSSTSSTHIILAKSRVAPLKPLSVPRLELCGALLLSQLFKTCLPLFTSRIHLNSILAFTDSTVVLAWLKTPPHLLKQFVANRVVEITSVLSPSNWHHVVTEENPADCASRGLMPHVISSHFLWFSGPSWLSNPRSQWPASYAHPCTDVPDLKPVKTSLLARREEPPELFIFSLYSSFQRMVRITAWLLRACTYFKRPKLKLGSTPLTPQELKDSLYILVKAVQAHHFSEDITNIKKGKDFSRNLRSLTPFLDPHGILRVGGRLRNSDLSKDAKHPILLPKNSTFTTLLIDSEHVRLLHSGPRAVQSIIQKQFWILSARQIIRSRLAKCLQCFKMRTQVFQPRMGDLPLDRVREARPFNVVGTDFGGPFLIRESLRRKALVTKAYLCLFICFSSKAVHLEVVSDLSTDAFLAAFDRFISRRGKCSTVFSDCGTNYVGAHRYISELHDYLRQSKTSEAISNHLANQSILWSFNPPSAPHFGGIWEAGIKSAKHLLRKVIGDRALTFEQLTTVFAKVEAVLNSRPLCPLSSDPSDLQALTPGHLLIGCAPSALPEIDITEVSQNRLSQWQLLRQMSQSFWARWRNEYLATLTQRQKWTKSKINVKEGDMVLLRDNKAPPLCWHLGRVLRVHPGQDEIVRVVTVKTAQGEFRRPVVKLAPLPSSA